MSINLLPWRTQEQKRQNYLFYSVGAIIVVTVLSCLVLLRFLILTQLKQLSIRPVFHGNHDHQTVIWLRKISRHQKNVVKTLVRLAQQVPSHCQLTQLVQHKNKITLTGKAESSQEIIVFIHRLKNIKSLKAVILKKMTQHGNVYFTIQTIMRT